MEYNQYCRLFDQLEQLMGKQIANYWGKQFSVLDANRRAAMIGVVSWIQSNHPGNLTAHMIAEELEQAIPDVCNGCTRSIESSLVMEYGFKPSGDQQWVKETIDELRAIVKASLSQPEGRNGA